VDGVGCAVSGSLKNEFAMNLVDATGFEPASIGQLGHYPKPSLQLQPVIGAANLHPQPCRQTYFKPSGSICPTCCYTDCLAVLKTFLAAALPSVPARPCVLFIASDVPSGLDMD